MTGPLIGCALNWGIDLGLARGHVLVQQRNKFYLKQNITAFVRKRSDISVACHLDLAIFVTFKKSLKKIAREGNSFALLRSDPSNV